MISANRAVLLLLSQMRHSVEITVSWSASETTLNPSWIPPRVDALNERRVSTGRRENFIIGDGDVKLFADHLRKAQGRFFGGYGLHDCDHVST